MPAFSADVSTSLFFCRKVDSLWAKTEEDLSLYVQQADLAKLADGLGVLLLRDQNTSCSSPSLWNHFFLPW